MLYGNETRPPTDGAADAETPMRGFGRLLRAAILLAGAVAVALVVGFVAFATPDRRRAPPPDAKPKASLC